MEKPFGRAWTEQALKRKKKKTFGREILYSTVREIGGVHSVVPVNLIPHLGNRLQENVAKKKRRQRINFRRSGNFKAFNASQPLQHF